MNDYKELIERLRTDSLDSRKASVSIMDLCMDAAAAIETLVTQLTASEVARSDLAKKLAVTRQERDLAVRRLSEIRDCDDCIHENDIPSEDCEVALGCESCMGKERCPCYNCGRENNWGKWEWNGSRSKAPMTNGDLFRRYTDEELGELLCSADWCENCDYLRGDGTCEVMENMLGDDGLLHPYCVAACLNYLRQPAEEAQSNE